MKPLHIFTPVWGEKNIRLLPRALMQSLRWPQNYSAIRHAQWNIFALPREQAQVLDIALTLFPKHQINFIDFPENADLKLCEADLQARGELMLYGLMPVMQQCVATGSQMLMALPDYIFGEGTLPTFARFAQPTATCVSVAHPRVLPSILPEITEQPLSNAQLVGLAFQHLHPSWFLFNADNHQTGSFRGGVSWRKISENLMAVQHLLPSPYWVNLTEFDVHFFSRPIDGTNPTFGLWDHNWLSELVMQERQRVIGSSDAAIMVEVTDEQLNVPLVTPANPQEPDACCFPQMHTRVNRQFLTIFRGE